MIRAYLALSVALACGPALAVDLNDIQLRAPVTPMQLKQQLNVDIIPPPGSPAALKMCAPLMAYGRKYEQCVNRVPTNAVPIASGDYYGQAKLWGRDADCLVKIDDHGRVAAIIVSFPSADFPIFEREATQKWGKPSNTGDTVIMQSVNGATATSTDDDWELSDGSTISLSSHHDMARGQLALKGP